MKNMKRTAIFLLLTAVVLSAQVRVTNTEVLDLGQNTIRPTFSDDGKYLLFTSYEGAAYHHLEENKTNYFSASASDYKMDADGNIRFRVDSFDDGLRVNSVMQFDSKTGETETILDKKRLDIIPTITEHGVYYIENASLKTNNVLAKPTAKPIVMSYDRSLLLVSYGTSKLMKPVGDDKFYIWPSISPDNSMISFVDINDLYVSDLNGQIIFKVNDARAPQWSPDGKWIAFMRDYDDGHSLTSSDLYLVRVADQEIFRLTETDDMIEMNPAWSPDGKKIVCDDAQNDKIVILTLDIR